VTIQQNEIQDAELKALLFRLELELMDPDVRKDREKVSALLAEEFREFGSSGRAWSRAAILDLLATEPWQSAPVVEEFEMQRIAMDAALVTYRTVRSQQATLRSSIWMLREGLWQMVFHQGTRMRG
jgi:hypothetical protein